MKSIFNFIVTPKESRSASKKNINGKELILNTELQNHQYVSRNAIVVETPLKEKTDVKKGDEVIIHHNIFRRFYDVRGNEKNSKSYFTEDLYFAAKDQIYLYKKNKEWYPTAGYCFVKPIVNKNKFSLQKEQPLIGILKYPNKEQIKNGIIKDTVVGFTPRSEYEFIIEGERLYRVPIKYITIKYGYKGNEEEYNTSWAQGS